MDSSVSPAFQEIKNIFASQDAVCLFFAISGLLVTASYERCESLREYFSRRVSRIFPLYLAAVIGAALLLSLASSMPAPCYFMHTDFWKYIFWNSLTLNFMQRTLPGVFEGNPFNSSVNDPLWTVKTELFFYACLPLICLLLHKCKGRTGRNLVLVALYFLSFAYRLLCVKTAELLSCPVIATLSLEAPGYIGAFVLGMFCYYNYDIIESFFSLWPSFLFFACFLFLVVYDNYKLSFYISDIKKYVLLAYVCFYAAFSFSFLNVFSRLTDCSYAIYLFHYPILQWMIERGMFDSNPWAALFLCASVTFVIALLATLAERKILNK